MAVPLLVPQFTVAVFSDGAPRTTVKTRLPASGPATSAIVKLGGGSSSMIVAVPVASPSEALTGPERLTEKVWLSSSRTSPMTVTLTCVVVLPGANTAIPDPAV